MKTQIETDYGTVNIIRTEDYFFAGFADEKECFLHIEAYPANGKSGGYFFRSRYTLFHKSEDESWLDFLASLDPDWAILPWARALVSAAFPVQIGDWVVTLDENLGGYVEQIDGNEAYVNFGSAETGWESLSNLKKG